MQLTDTGNEKMRQSISQNSQPAPRPLYIESQSSTLVRLDGPAVSIAVEEKEPSYIPLRRISRIHISRHVDVDTDVLLECAERGIMVILHDEDGNTAARVVGNAGAMTAFRQRLNDLTTRVDWKERYQTWRYSQRRRICALLVQRMHAPGKLRDQPQQTQDWFQQQIERMAGAKTAEQTRKLFYQACLVWTQEHLVQCGLGAENELWLTGKPDLAADMANLLAFRIETIRLGWIRGISRNHATKTSYTRITHKGIIIKLEQQRPRIQRLGRGLVNRLHCWLVEMS